MALSMEGSTAVVALLVLCISCLLLLFRRNGSGKTGRLPPGPRPLPIVGNLHQLDAKNMVKSLRELSKKYGSVYTIYLGSQPVVVLCGYQAMKEALVDQGEEFSGRGDMPILFRFTQGNGIILSQGEKWKVLRHFAIQTLRNFGMGKRSIEERIQEEAQCLVEELAKTKAEPFDPTYLINLAVSNIICSIIFGDRFDYKDEKFLTLIGLLRDNLQIMCTPSAQEQDETTQTCDALQPCGGPRQERVETPQMWYNILEFISAENLPMVSSLNSAASENTGGMAAVDLTISGDDHRQESDLTIDQSGDVLMRSILGLPHADFDTSSTRKQRKLMLCIVRSAVFGILRHCLNKYLRDTCLGCQIEAKGQSSHECLTWPKSVISRKLRVVCGKICFKSVLHIVILIAYSLNCLLLTQVEVDKVLILITKIGRAQNSLKHMNQMLKESDERMLNYVMEVIKNKPYKQFFQLYN